MSEPRREQGAGLPPRRRRCDLAVLAAVVGLVAAVYLPMLATGRSLSAKDDFLIHCA